MPSANEVGALLERGARVVVGLRRLRFCAPARGGTEHAQQHGMSALPIRVWPSSRRWRGRGGSWFPRARRRARLSAIVSSSECSHAVMGTRGSASSGRRRSRAAFARTLSSKLVTEHPLERLVAAAEDHRLFRPHAHPVEAQTGGPVGSPCPLRDMDKLTLVSQLAEKLKSLFSAGGAGRRRRALDCEDRRHSAR